MARLSNLDYMRKKKAKKSLFRLGIGAVVVVLVGSLFFLLKSFMPPCANSISCIKDLSGKYEPQKEGTFLGQKVAVPAYVADVMPESVLGESIGSNKRIGVNLSTQTLYAYQNSKLVYTFPVSTGKWYPTPTGEFHIWVKLRYTLMTGGNQAWGTYYYLPNVPYVMFYYNDQISKYRGFSLHGTYWHHNFGHPMSHGCINMRTEDAQTLFYWTNPVTTGNLTYATKDDPGTLIVIYGTTPAE